MKLIIFFALLLLLTSAAATKHKSRHPAKAKHETGHNSKNSILAKLRTEKHDEKHSSLAKTMSDSTVGTSGWCGGNEQLQAAYDETCGDVEIAWPADQCISWKCAKDETMGYYQWDHYDHWDTLYVT
jgi:hypothetical protein